MSQGEELEHRNRSFSLEGEDMIIDRYFKHKASGFYVDVGAHHPTRFSNTMFFYEKGWRGINIDPSPGAMREFERIRPEDINLEVGVGSQRTQRVFFQFDESALNSFDAGISEDRIRRGCRLAAKIQLNIIPLRELLELYVPKDVVIDFMSIDVEGLEIEVLESNDWTGFAPELIAVECSGFGQRHGIFDPGFQNHPVIVFVESKGYRLMARTIDTAIFARSDELSPSSNGRSLSVSCRGRPSDEVLTDSNGIRFILQACETRFRERHLERSFDRDVFDFYDQHLKIGDRVIDVGAHIGRYAVYASRLIGASGWIDAFEPVSETFWRLQCTLALNRVANVRTHHLAVLAENSLADIHLYPPEFSSWASFSPHVMEAGEGSIMPVSSEKVPAVSLDNFFTEENLIFDLLKIDVEGFELSVLRGAENMIRSGRVRAIVFELSQAPMKGQSESPLAIFHWLSGMGYEILHLRQGGSERVNLETIGSLHHGNFAALLSR